MCIYGARVYVYGCVSEANWGAGNWGFPSCCAIVLLCVCVLPRRVCVCMVLVEEGGRCEQGSGLKSLCRGVSCPSGVYMFGCGCGWIVSRSQGFD